MHTATTAIIGLTIDKVSNNQDHLLAQHFHPGEREELENSHVRSMAGWLAVKQAILKVLEEVSCCRDEKNIELSRSSNGRPWIKNIYDPHGSPLKLTSRVTISISHTRITAYGMAVYEKP